MRWSLFVLLLPMFGCVKIPQLDEEKKLTVLSLDATRQDALSTADFTEGDWPNEKWWEMFQDRQLEDLIQKGLAENPTMLKAIAQMEQAWQMAKSQRAYLLPELDFNAQDNWQYFGKNGFFRSFAATLPASINQIDISINFSYEVDFWGKNRHLFEAALGQARSQTAETAQTEILISVAIALAYIDLQTDLKKLTILKESKNTRSAILNLVNLRKNNALSTEIESIQRTKPLLDVDAELIQYQQQIELDKNLIKILIGQGPDQKLLDLQPTLVLEKTFPLPDQIGLNLLSRRPDLMAQIWRAEAAAHQIGVAKTYFYPNFNLSAFGGFESLAFGNIFSWNSKMGSLLPSLNLPIFTAGRLRANVNAREAEYESAVYEYNELLLSAAKEVADQIIVFNAVNNQLTVQKNNLSALKKSYDLSLARYIYAVSNYLFVLEANEEVLQQQLLIADLEHNRLVAALKLIKALGGGYHNPSGSPLKIAEAGHD